MGKMKELNIGIIFDLDGTLVDSVYQHVLAWQDALNAEGIELSVWRIHRRIGMSGGLFTNMLLRETKHEISNDAIERLQQHHAEAYKRHGASVRPLPGARALLDYLTEEKIPWAIATSGNMVTASITLEKLGVDPNKSAVITRDQVRHAKPNPDLFLAAAERIKIPIEETIIVGDAIWDMLAARRARGFGVGLLSGGYGQDELERAGANRVFEDTADMLRRFDEIGARP